ncbi:MAG: response regulator [Pseudomonadota bacterium]
MAKHIVVAEDEPNIAKSVTFLLEREGYRISVETVGTRVVDAVFESAPDLLLLDVMLPGENGYQILERLRSDARTQRLPVVILSAKGQSEDRENALKAGADKFVTKPFSNSELVEAISDLL